MEQIKELKVKAYDILALIEQHQNDIKKLSEMLSQVNEEIAIEYQKMNQETTNDD